MVQIEKNVKGKLGKKPVGISNSWGWSTRVVFVKKVCVCVLAWVALKGREKEIDRHSNLTKVNKNKRNVGNNRRKIFIYICMYVCSGRLSHWMGCVCCLMKGRIDWGGGGGEGKQRGSCFNVFTKLYMV